MLTIKNKEAASRFIYIEANPSITSSIDELKKAVNHANITIYE